jgi:hypothetical protein
VEAGHDSDAGPAPEISGGLATEPEGTSAPVEISWDVAGAADGSVEPTGISWDIDVGEASGHGNDEGKNVHLKRRLGNSLGLGCRCSEMQKFACRAVPEFVARAVQKGIGTRDRAAKQGPRSPEGSRSD